MKKLTQKVLEDEVFERDEIDYDDYIQLTEEEKKKYTFKIIQLKQKDAEKYSKGLIHFVIPNEINKLKKTGADND